MEEDQEIHRGGPEGDGIEGQVRTTLRETKGQMRDLWVSLP
jgi:hypothetical protein